MRQIILMIACALILAGCSRDQIQDGITDSLRGACAQNNSHCSIRCPIGEMSDARGECRRE
jgi:hypothetical protein